MTTKREAEVIEEMVCSMTKREYLKFVDWLGQGASEPLWNYLRPFRLKREARDAAVTLGGDVA